MLMLLVPMWRSFLDAAVKLFFFFYRHTLANSCLSFCFFMQMVIYVMIPAPDINHKTDNGIHVENSKGKMNAGIVLIWGGLGAAQD